jgi:hypothetical protein
MKTTLMAASAIFLAGICSSQATILRDTIGGDTYGAPGSTGWSVYDAGGLGAQSIGLGFSTAASTQVNGIKAFISPSDPLNNPLTGFTLGIMQDNGSGIPTGSFLHQSSVSADLTNPVILNNLNWSIGTGSYFLVAIAEFGTTNAWQMNPGLAGPFAFTFGDPNSNWTSFSSALPEAIISTENIPTRVSGVPLHPSAWPMMALGSALFGWLAFQRRQVAV